MTKEQKKRQLIRARLQSLEDKHGRLTAKIVVMDAKKKSSPLHGEFEWDLNKAAWKHWEETARRIIANVWYERSETTQQIAVPYYVRDPEAKPNEQGYRSLDSLRNEKENARLVLIGEFKLIRALMDRAHAISKVLEMEDDLISIKRDIDRLYTKIENHPVH